MNFFKYSLSGLIRYTSIIVAVGILSACNPGKNQQDASMNDPVARAKTLNKEGLGFYAIENYQVALGRFEEAAELDPNEAEYPNNQGMCRLRLGQAEEAADLFEKSIKLNGKLDTYHLNLGLALMNLNKPREAADAFKAATERNGKNLAAWAHLGMAQYALGQKGAAEKSWLAASALGDDAEVENNLGMIYMETGKNDEAEKRFRHSALLSPTYATPLFNLGVLYQQKKGDLAGSTTFYEQAIARDPSAYAAYMNLGITHRKLGNIPAARRNLEAFLKTAPPSLSPQLDDARKMLRDMQQN